MNAYVRGEWIVIVLPEKLDRADGLDIEDLTGQSTARRCYQIVFDAKNLEYIGSFGISTLIRKTRDLRAAGGEVKISHLHGQPLRIIMETGLNTVLNVEGAAMEQADLVNPSKTIHSKPEFKCVEEKDILHIHLCGSFYFPSGCEILSHELKKLEEKKKNVLLHLENALYVDSQSINEILKFNYACRNKNTRLVLCEAKDLVAETLEILNIKTVIPTCNTEAEALTHLNG